MKERLPKNLEDMAMIPGGALERISHKVGDKVKLPSGEEGVVVSVLPAIKEDCDHEWVDGPDHNPEFCSKCGISFTRYIFCCCP